MANDPTGIPDLSGEINTEVLTTTPWHAKRFSGDKPTVTVNKEKVINRQGKQFVLYSGLLDAAHRAGMQSMFTNLVQAPTSLNGGIAIVHATVEFPWGSYTGIGDADDENVGRMIVPHKIRMAETRAKARALRDALNVDMVTVEEMTSLPPDKGDDQEEEEPRPAAPRSGNTATRRPAAPVPPDRRDTPAPPAPPRGNGTVTALDKFNRLKETYLKLADAHALVRDDALIAPFTADATESDIDMASQRLLTRINTAVQRKPNGGSA